MSVSTLTVPRPTPVEVATTPPAMGPGARVASASAALLCLAATGTAPFAGPEQGVGIADGAAAAVGATLALVQGANASDRRGRRRLALVGLALLGLGVLAHVVAVVVVAGLLLGLGSAVTVMSASGWLADARLGRGTDVVLALIAVAGAAAVSASSSIAGAAILAAAVAATVVAPEPVVGRRTPVFVTPAMPRLAGRPAAIPALVVLATALAVPSLGVAGGLVVVAAMTSLVAVSAVARRRPAAPTPLVGTGRAYRRAVAVFDASASPRPALATTVRSVDHVVDAVATARGRGLGVGMHSTGHAAVGLADLTSSALLKVAIEEPITVDAERRLVRVPAGRAWAEVVTLLEQHGLAVAHGSSGHVGVVGYLTRGGLSAYGRHTGVAPNWIESIELVTADGERVVTSREQDPELFWALRGGGGGLGVVTAVTVRAFVPGEIVTGTTMWELADADAVSQAWAQWSAVAPSAITTSLRVLTLPPLPGMPMGLTRRPMLVIDGTAVDGDVTARDAAGDLLGRLRTAGVPRLDTWRVSDVAEVPNTHMDPPFSPAHSSAHALLGAGDSADVEQARAVVADFVAAAARPDTGIGIAELRQLGGALASSPADAGVVGHYRGAFGWLAIALHGKPGREAAETAIDHQAAALAGWETGFTAPTLAAERGRPARSFPAADVAAVDAVRRRVDPHGVFRVDIAPGAHSALA